MIIIILSKLAVKIGLIDYPGPRKIHKIPTPVIGGIALFIILLFADLSKWFTPLFGVQ